MKQENSKKSKKWLLIVIAIIALLAAAAVALVFILGGNNNQGENQGEPPVDDTPTSAVYFNPDRAANTDPETGLSAREPGEDGLYTIRFISEGKVIELKTADKQLVNFIDTMDTVGLVLDAEGLIIEALNVKDIAIENAKNFYVKKVDGNTITVNSSIAMNGMDLTFTLTDAAHVMDVREGSETLGQSVQLEVMDMVSVYSNKEEVVTSVFLHERSEASPLYLRVDRFYDSKTASTTRVPDKDGVYTIPFAMGGEVLQLKCKDKNIVTGLDSGTDAKQVMGLTFDEEGYITGSITAATAVRGKLLCQVYNVTAINGNTIEATRLMSGSEQGKVVNFTLTEETEIIMNEIGCNHFIGEKVDGIVMNDRVVVWSDMDGNALYIKIDRRQVTGDDIAMYYLKSKKWDSATASTTRGTDAKGYYVFELASKGKMVTVKTKSKDLANLMDGNSYQFFGLKVKGGIVQEYYDKDCLSAGYGIGGQRFVTDVMANIVRIVSGTDFASGGNYMLTDKTEIYNMTGYNGKLGSKTTLQIGDRVIASRDVQNNITHIYVLDRPASGSTKFYYNKTRKYNSTTLETSRTPDADEYYVFTMYCEGKEVEVKTKDKDIATIIDQQNAPIAALKVNKDGIVTAAYPAIAGKKYASKVFNYNTVGEITKDKVVSCYYFSNGVKTAASKSYPMAKNCKIYNVSTNYDKYRGEKSTLKVGDKIQALYDIETGELTHIWIINRMFDSPLYLNTKRSTDSVKTPDADGYYSIELFVDGQIKTFRTKDLDLITAVNANGSETFFAMKTDGDIILRTDSYSASKKASNLKVSFQDVMKISGKTITTQRMRPGQSNTGATTEFTYTSKTKIYDVSYYSENQYKAAKLKKGDRISVYADAEGNVSYIFILYPHLREKGYMSKCSHCNKTVWWEPYTGSFIHTADNVHYYQPSNYLRSGQGTVGRDETTYPGTMHYTAIFDMNGKTLTCKARNFLVYSDLILIDSVGGGVLEATGYQGGSGGNFMVAGGTVEVNDGITLRMAPEELSPMASSGGNFVVSNKTVKDANGDPIRTYTGKVTINDATLEGWAGTATGSSLLMHNGTELVFKKGTIKGGTIELTKDTKFSWKGGTIESNLNLNGTTVALSGKPNFSGILMTSNGGKVDISELSTEASIKALPSGVFTTESDNIDAYLNVFTPAVDSCTIVKEGKALAASVVVPSITENLQFVPGTEMAACPVCEKIVTWKPITQAAYGETNFGNASDGLHLYLAEDVTYTGAETNFINAPSRNAETNTPYVACFHLNGHNFTATNKNVAHGSYGILNFMGSGTVSGNGGSGATITMNTNRGTGGINLLSGTYIKAAGNKTGVVQINGNGGNITIGKDAVILTEEDDVAVKFTGGGCIDTNLVISGTVEGGYVESTVAGKPNSADLDGGENLIYFILDGGNLKGGAKLAEDTNFAVLGAAKVGGSGLDLTSGVKIQGSELTEGASIAVAANGVFTENIKVDEQKGFYVPAPKYLAIEVIGQTLSIKRDPNAAPDLPKDPATPAKPTVLDVDNSNLVFEEGTTNAKCPVCNEVVEWIAITDATEGVSLEGEKHYYLANDITYAGTASAINYEVYQSKVTCLHLNGHNITATAGKAIYSGGYLNVMGNGTVTGNGTEKHRGATVEVNSASAQLNLYGGTYLRAAENATNPIINVHGNGGSINLFDEAVVDGREAANYMLIRSWCGSFNMYGGTVYGGSATAVSGSNWTYRSDGTGSGTVNIYGGLIQGGSGAAVSVGGAKKSDGSMTALAHLGIYGGTINGGVSYNANTEAIIGGNPVLTRLNIPSNKTGDYKGLFTLGRLTEGASITVYGSDAIFTTQSENVETYRQYFKAQSDKAIEIKEYALALVASGTTPDPEPDTPSIEPDPKVPELPSKLTVDNSNLVLDGNNQAKCPVCDQVVTWTAITDGSNANVLIGNTHYYLANDINYEGTDAAIKYPYSSDYSRKTACLHLNGKNVTATNGLAFFAGNYLNIMGNGNVSGNMNNAGRGAVVDVNSSVAKVNIYGGTYKKSALTNERDLVRMNGAGGIINIYQGVTIDSRDTKGNTVCLINGTVNIYGGELFGGTSGHVAYAGYSTSGGNTVSGTLNIFGGLLQAKEASGVGAIGNATKKAVMNVYGGQVRGGTAVKDTAEVTIGGTAVMNRLVISEGCKITLAEMSQGASVTVSANGVFTNPSSNASTYVNYFHGLSGYKTPTVVNNALFTEEGTDPETPGTEPEVPAFNNANLIFEAGTNKAMCPVCGEVKEWIAITQEAHGENGAQNPNEGGKHYYLAEDITYTGTANFFQGPGSSKLLCIHLNGHNWTGTQAQFLFGYGSKSRVMGNGIVANGKNSARSGAVIWNTGTKSNVDIQLYGGTYTVTPENTKGSAISIDNNGGDITIHEGATVIGSATAPAIYVGTSGVRTSVLTIKDAQVYGSVLINSPKTPDTYATTIVVEDAKLNVVELNKNVSFTVKGNTTIEKLIVAEGAKFTVGELGANAKINVQGNGVISEAGANVTTYKDQIISTYGCELKVEGNALVARDLNKLDNSNLVFAEGTTKAVCPYCQVEVEWEAISDDSATFDVQAKKHYYLTKNLNFPANGLLYDKYGLANMTCLHLNGYNITAGGRAIYAGGFMNIMGNGTVSGNFTHASQVRGATLDVNAGNSNRLNLFGGTYTKAVENTKMPIVAVFEGGGNINMYAGATIDGTGTSVSGLAGGCLLIANKEGRPGNFTMYGGTIKNGTNTNNHGGNIRISAYGNFTMYGGTVSGGASPIQYGGNIFASGGTLNLLGGSILNGHGRIGGNIATQMYNNGNTANPITIKTVLNLKNVEISGGHGEVNPEVAGSVSHGGNISIERTTMTIGDGTYIHNGTAGNQGGNLRVFYSNVTMNGGYITNGHVGGTNTNENVWVIGSATEQGSFTMNGGVIYANSATIGVGSAIQASANTTVTLAGDAIVIANPANTNKPIFINAAATLVKDPSWTGIGATNKD